MKHAVNSRTRLKGGVSRFFTRMFNSGDPHGWGDYHIVPETGDTLWVHTHGLDNFGLLNLEFESVPADLRDEAIRLMLALVMHGRTEQHLEVDGDFSGALSADAPGFRQVGTLRSTNHGDAEHRGLVRVVDLAEPMGAGFPGRLFASHLVARAVETPSAKRREQLFRRALEIFPGEPAPQDMRVDESGGDPDMTELQQISNLGARMGLAGTLLERDARDEGLQVLEEAIAFCPGWAREYKRHASDGGNDFHSRFWADADIDEISRRLRHAAGSAPAQDPGEGRAGGGFGSRPAGFGSRALGTGS
jgi:hypothetical protein